MGNTERYTLMKLEDESWIELIPNRLFTDVGYNVQPFKNKDNEIKFSNIDLSIGKYKLIIEIFVDGKAQDGNILSEIRKTNYKKSRSD